MENLVNELICRTVKQLRTHTSARHGRIDPPDIFPGRKEMNHSGGPPGRDGEKRPPVDSTHESLAEITIGKPDG